MTDVERYWYEVMTVDKLGRLKTLRVFPIGDESVEMTRLRADQLHYQARIQGLSIQSATRRTFTPGSLSTPLGT